MAGAENELKGPDLAAGIPLGDIPDGGSLLGHAGGEPVLLARQGDELFAVGATCTHYSGPLAEGLIVGDEVRCPWHHACFSLRTGEALRAPALNPIPCYDLVRDGAQVKVGARKAPAAPPVAASGPDKVVIVGGGAAGEACAEMLRRHGHRGSITILSDDKAPPVDRPNLSKDYLAGTAPEEWIPLRPPEFFAEHEIDVVLGVAVERIDAKSRRVHGGGRDWPYDALLLATGAEPIRLAVPGADGPGVHLLRTLEDSRALIAAAREAKRAVVIGGSFIALEVSAALRARGVAVDVVAPEALPLERVLGRALGHFVKSLHEDKGVRFHLGRRPTAIDGGSVTLDDGTVLGADLVVMGVGVKPRIDLARTAGCQVDVHGGGVHVDDHMRTSVHGIFAAGDIAGWVDGRGERRRVEHWAVAQRQGQVAARAMLGQEARFDSAPFFWSVHYDVTIAYVGWADPVRSDIVVEGDFAARDAKVTYSRDGRVRAVATVFRDLDSLKAELELERG